MNTSYFAAPGRTSQLIVGRSVGWNLVIPCKTVAVLITNVYFGVQGPINTLEGHRTGILNWYDFQISTGRLERINNKIGALERAAYGYRDRDYFIAKLYALHLAKFELIG